MYWCIYKYTGGLIPRCIGASINIQVDWKVDVLVHLYLYRWTGRWMFWCIYKYTDALVGGCIGASINIQVDWKVDVLVHL